LCGGRRAPSGFEDVRGSSFDRESFREEDIPDGDEDRELWVGSGVEEAREASSRESLGGGPRFSYLGRDMAGGWGSRSSIHLHAHIGVGNDGREQAAEILLYYCVERIEECGCCVFKVLEEALTAALG